MRNDGTGRASGAAAGGAGAPLVLVADDVDENREMVAHYLRLCGFRVAEATDGEDAVDKAVALRPDVIVMDLSMPRVDGWEATRRLKAMPEKKGIPIIALTAHAMSGDREKALEAGCDDYDTKPIELPRLLGKIEALLAKPPAAS